MIRHVVLWRLKSSNGDRFHAVRTALEAQLGRIPALLRVEVGRNFAASRRAEHWIVDYELTKES
jgi:hypothetical protein